MSSAELTEWIAFYNLEPFGGDTKYIGDAITASTIANVNRKKGSKAMKPDDFIPKFEAKKEQGLDEMLQVAKMMTAALGGEDKTDDG